MASAPRPFSFWMPAPTFFRQIEFSESASFGLLTRTLRRYADVPEKGRLLFKGNLAQQNALYRELRSYITQAITYLNAAISIDGSSAALPLYYFGLNLAKAELLTSDPSKIIGKKILHGLRYDPSSGRKMISDFVTVSEGVFPLLYKKRTGHALPPGTRLPIRRLMANIPEIGWELAELGISSPNVGSLVHAIVGDQSTSWSLIATQAGALVTDDDETGRRFRRHYEEIDPPGAQTLGEPPAIASRRIFALTTRHMSAGYRFFQGKWQQPTPQVEPIQLPLGWIQFELEKKLGPLIQEGNEESADAELVGSLYRSKWLPMPSGLARYVVMFYLSSLVRYKPSEVDQRASPTQAWLADAMTDQLPLWMVRDSLSGISGVRHLFRSSNSFRT